jgi:serine/threonine-protein kinase HipA
MARQGQVFFQDKLAGILEENDEGYSFTYDSAYLSSPSPHAISLTLPLSKEPFLSPTLFAFFDGLIPEGWLLNIAVDNWKLDPRDRMGLLLATCRNPIGAVSVLPLERSSHE